MITICRTAKQGALEALSARSRRGWTHASRRLLELIEHTTERSSSARRACQRLGLAHGRYSAH